MEHRELRILWDWTIPLATLPHVANTWQRPTPVNGGGELEKDEVAEMVYLEVFPPRTILGVNEALHQIIPIVDGKEYGDYVSISGRYDGLMTPPLNNAWGARIYSFGDPVSNNPLRNTTLKYKTDLSFAFLAGATNITQQYRLRAWGYIYKEGELARDFGTMAFPVSIRDSARNRVLTINKSPIAVSRSTWLTLPGGKDQGPPKINPFIRFAYNALVTDGIQGEYPLRYNQLQVTLKEEDMYFDFDSMDALLVEGLGVRSPANLAWTYLQISGDVHPKGRTVAQPGFPTQQFNNPLHFGHLFPLFATDFPAFRAIPRLDRPYLIWNERGYVAIRDAGAVVAAGAAMVALSGIRIELRG